MRWLQISRPEAGRHRGRSDTCSAIGALTIEPVFGVCFAIASQVLLAGVDTPVAYVPRLVGFIIALVVILSVGHVVAAILEHPESADERDRLIAWRPEYDASGERTHEPTRHGRENRRDSARD